MIAQTLLLLLLLRIGNWESGVNAFAIAPNNPSSLPTATTTSTTTTKSSSLEDHPTLTLFSPCKVNLFLRILRRRPDGYHDLASLFQAVNFGDTLTLSLLPSNSATTADTFDCNMPGVPTDSTNLVLRALDLFRNKIEKICKEDGTFYFDAHLHKECPAQAGLGGGSANAATALWGANELLGRPATLEQVRSCVYLCLSVVIDESEFCDRKLQYD